MKTCQQELEAAYGAYHEECWKLREAHGIDSTDRSRLELEAWDRAEAALAEIWKRHHT